LLKFLYGGQSAVHINSDWLFSITKGKRSGKYR